MSIITMTVSSVRTVRREPLFVTAEAKKREIYSRVKSELSNALKEGVVGPVDIESGYAKEMLLTYAGTPKDLCIGSNVCCHNAKVQVTSYKTYYMESKAAYSPDDFNSRYGHYPNIYASGSPAVAVHTMRGPQKHGLGRAGGATGWDKYRDAFAFGLASFRHNFECLMGVFASRPKLPCGDEWHLPNLVYDKEIAEREKTYRSSIVEPPVAVPPASYEYNFALPTPMVTLGIGTKCPKDVETYLEVWNGDKEDMVEPLKVTFPQGESETVVTLNSTSMLPTIKSGFLNINPVNSEMTISYVNLYFPPV